MKLKKFLKRVISDKYIIILLVFSLALLASVVRFGLRTYKVPEWDEQHYMAMAAGFYRLIKYNLSFNTPYDMLQIVPFRQLGYPLMIVPFLFIFGLSKAYFWGIFTNGLLYVATIFGIYFLARNFLSSLSSFLAAFTFAFYGWTLLHLHLTYSETASSAFIVWTLLFLVKSNLFQNKKYSLLFGLFLGLGLFVRWVIIAYILGPLIYAFYQMLKKSLFKKEVLFNIGLSFLISFLISFYQYLHNYYWMFQYFYSVRVGSEVWQALPRQETNPFSLYSLTFYLNSFAQLGILFFVLIVIGFILAFRKKSKLKPILFITIAGYLFSIVAPIKGERYIVPIFPYLAVLSASVFDYIKKAKIKYLLALVTIILSIFSFLGSTWGKGPMKQSLVSLPIELPFGQWKEIYLTTYSRPPYIYKISGKEILDYIEKDIRAGGIKDPQILSLFYYRPLDEPLMTYNFYNQEKPLNINNYLGTIISDPDKEAGILIRNVFMSDYILTKTGQRTDNFFSQENYKTLKALIELFDKDVDIFDNYEEKKKFWIYQDSSEVTVFKKNKEISKQEAEFLALKLSEILKREKSD